MPALTVRDLEILEAVTRRVRVLTIPQIARTWWASSKRPAEDARARLQSLRKDDLLLIERLPAHPELTLQSPITSWEPGVSAPDFGVVSYRLQSRWSEHPVSTMCVSATTVAANRFGGHGGRLPRQVERTHDIHLAAVYLLYRDRHSEVLSNWIFEEQLRHERREKAERLPDAILVTAGRRKVVEFGGAYPKAKLEAFHAYCKERELPYEVW